MSQVPNDLGARILDAARLAVTAHWQQTLASHDGLDPNGQQSDAGGAESRDGGAGVLRVTEDQLSLADDGGAEELPRRLSGRRDPHDTAYEITLDLQTEDALLEEAVFLSDGAADDSSFILPPSDLPKERAA